MLGCDFNIEAFQHEARYNSERGCIEMFLRSTREQQVDIRGEVFTFAAGERLHTENSYKYAPGEFLQLAQASGFDSAGQWLDAQAYFGLYLLKAH